MGRWVHHLEDIAKSFTEFYQNLFAFSNPTIGEVAMNPLVKIVIDDMNAQLSQEFMEWEVQAALKQIAPLKAPSLDGIPPLFYQNYWSLVGDDVTNTILSYLNKATICHPLNHTFLTLIPKIKNLVFVSDYHPISLCNVLYKIFSKVLANRLKKILPSIINEQQSAFTKNCLISDNILVAFETLHCMNNHKSSKTGYMAIKLDMSKAYNRFGWIFLEEVMRKLGFNKRWINLMMTYVKTVSYSVLVNGEPKRINLPYKGYSTR